jgi:signal transduction histidine kinase
MWAAVTALSGVLQRGMRSLSAQLTLVLVLFAFLPMAVLGWVALQSIASASRETAAEGYIATANATATTLTTYVESAANNLLVLGNAVSLAPALDESLDPQLRRFVIEHPHFRRVTLLDAKHRVLATSILVERPATLTPLQASGRVGGVTLTTVTSDDALLPNAQLLVPVIADTPATLVADLSLEYLWRAVHTLDLPPDAHAILVDQAGRVLAHSDPAHQTEVARAADLRRHPALRDGARHAATTYTTPEGVEWLAIAAPMPQLHWTLLIEQPTLAIDQPALSARRQLTAVLLVTVICTALVLVLAGRTLTAPLQALTHATRALAHGERTPRVPVPRHLELANLAHAFNFLVERLDLLEATVRRQERDAVIGKIGAGLLHDLAHPIRNIVNNARLLPRLDDEGRRDCLQLIQREYATIDELFDNLREYSRATPRLTQPVLPHLVVRDIATRLHHEAQVRDVTLLVPEGAPPAPITTDRGALHRVLRNLVVNAIEAAQATRGTVTITAEDLETRVRITVADTGPGLSPEQLATLFDAFRSTKRKGLGLGLATALRLVEQMGGTLTATSRVGAGTTCVIDLPRASPNS